MTDLGQTACGANDFEASGTNLLVVDDEENARRALRRLLTIVQDRGTFNVFEASAGQEALTLMQDVPMQCVLLDIQMPGGAGTEWLPRMLESQPNAAVIIVTGAHNEEQAVDAMKRGALDYLVKGSISPWSLQRAIINGLETVRMRSALDKQREQLLIAERHPSFIGAACPVNDREGSR